MTRTSCTLAVALIVALAGAATAQTPAGGGSAEGNLNNPGSVKSNEEKRDERVTGSATGGPAATGGVVAPGGAVGVGADTAAPTSGHSSGGGTSSGGMAR